MLNLTTEINELHETLPFRVGRAVARAALEDALKRVPDSNRRFLIDAIERLQSVSGTLYLAVPTLPTITQETLS